MKLATVSLLLLTLCFGSRGTAAQTPPTQPGQGSDTHAVRRSSSRPPDPPRIPAIRWFTDQPRQYVLLEPFKYQPRRNAEPIVVPAGFVTDFASIPGPLVILFGPSVHDLPAVVHDYLYWRQACTRDQADRIFYQALENFGVAWPRRVAIRGGLALGGALAYGQNAEDRKQRLPRIIPVSELQIPMTTWEEYRKGMRQRRVPLDPPDPKPPAYCQTA